MQKPNGPYASLCTPFDTSSRVDFTSLSAMVEFGIANGAAGFLCTAIAGEVEQLTLDERVQIAEAVPTAVQGRAAVIVGLGSGPFETLETVARAAERTGAHGVMLPAQGSWELPGADSLSDVLALAAAVDVEVMLQQAPRYSKTSFATPVLVQAAELLAGRCSLKLEGGGDVVEEMRRYTGDTPVWGGDGGIHLLDCLRAGAYGVIPGLEIIDVLAGVYALELGGSPDDADAALAVALPLLVLEMRSQATYVCIAKRVLVARGLIATDVSRIPGASLSPLSEAAVDRAFNRAVGLPFEAPNPRVKYQ